LRMPSLIQIPADFANQALESSILNHQDIGVVNSTQ